MTSQWQVTGSTTYALSYAYNYAGMLTSETYPSNRTVSYTYGTAGKLYSVSDGTTTFANNFSYDPSGGLTSETWGNTAVHTIAYNHAQQASQVKLSITSGGSTTVLQQYDYDYGTFNTSTGAVDTTKNNGQIGKITGSISGTAQWNQGFSYDELGRLSNIVEHQGSSMSTQTFSQSYGYDRYGNKTQSANSTLGLPAVASTDYDTTNHNNRFVSSVATYDGGQAGVGNITTDSKFRGLTYAYDANNRQTSASNGTWTETQTYDCAGQRVQTSVSGVGSTTYRTMVYDIFGQDAADYSGSSGSTLERENIYRGGLLATDTGGSNGLKYVLQDAQASTRAVMDNNSGSSLVLARHDFLPFGEEIPSALRGTGQGYGADYTNRQKYGLTERDETTGLDHTWFRKYENLSGRWTSPDPYGGSMSTGDPQSFNRYSYVHNDPSNFVDPTGLDCFAVFEVTTVHYADGKTSITWDYLYAYCTGPSGGGGGGGVGAGGGGGGGGPAGLGKNQKKYDKAKNKLLNKDLAKPKEKCAKLLALIGLSLSEITAAVNQQVPYSGPDTTGLTVLQAGLVRAPDPKLSPDMMRLAIIQDNQTVSDYFDKHRDVGASTALYGGNPNNVFFRSSGITDTGILHEALHSATGLDDIALAGRLGLGTFTSGSAASDAINRALRKNGCTTGGGS